MQWLEKTLQEEYQFIQIIKKTEKVTLTRLRHKLLQRDLIEIRFKGEGEIYKILQKIHQENLPCIYDVIEEDGECTVLEEFIDGITIDQVLETGLYTEKGVRQVAKSLCNALEALHLFHIIHRDIKPENVMVSSTGRVVLLDFDAARIYKAYRAGDTFFSGTAGYAAPEQFGISQSDVRTDVFSLGILMNVMLTGEHPSKLLYRGRLGAVIEKCIHLDPNQRYASVLELADFL